MKKTLTINLNGYVFNIDNDAYDMLNNYLDEIGKHFGSDERDEIMKDIEARIAELFTERMNSRNVVDMADVTQVIETLGHPEQFDNIEEEIPSDKKTERANKRKHRKLYRDVDNQLLGGVAAGMAAYVGWDITIMRLIFVLLLILGFGWIIPIYLIMWLLLPEAKTAAQKLEMQGIEPNIENIKNYMQSDRFKEAAERVGSRMGEVFMWIVKILFIAVCASVGLGFFAVVAGLIIALFVLLVGGSTFIAPFAGETATIVILVGTMLLFLCPAIGLTAACVHLINPNKTPRRRWAGWVLFLVWIISIFMVIGASLHSGTPHISELTQWGHQLASQVWNENIDESNYISETRSCKNFSTIDAERAVRVVLTQGDEEEVVVKAPDVDLRNIETRVEKGILYIKNNNDGNIKRVPVVYVTAKNIVAINAKEATSIKCDNDLKLNDIYITVEEASHIQLSGEINNVVAKVSEASNADFGALKAQKFSVEVKEASNATIGTTETADLKAKEGSNISYKSPVANLTRDCDMTSAITEIK